MVAIADKLGKASISTNYAVATTVKTARTVGVTVLEAFDLSKFSPDTPVFFITYKKTTDPLTGDVSVTNQISWKALVNPDNNTLTNLTLAPGYTDTGNDVGDFVECIPTSFWGNSLIEALLESLNPDGSMKPAAVKTALGITGETPPDWTVLPITPTVVSNNGQKEHLIRYAGVDYTSSIGVGSKLRILRTGTTPTTSMAFVAASSQYAIKTSPVGMAQTDDITAEALIYLDSYADGTIEAKIDSGSANGWRFSVNANGQVAIVGLNAGASNYRQVPSYQSVPLGKWVHVAASLDMSSWTSATNKVWIDGVDVPAALNQSGTNPTSFVSAGDFAIGRTGAAASGYFNGKSVNARLWSEIRTTAQIRDNMGMETPAGSLTNLKAHFKGNGSWSDSSTNANHLTAVGGAVNNFASHPYSAIEYAIATKVAYDSGNNRTDVTIFTGSGCLPNETLGASSYSSARAPFGFPADKTKWRVQSLMNVQQSQSSVATNVWYNIAGFSLIVPTGAWQADYRLATIITGSSVGYLGAIATLSSANNSETNRYATASGSVSAAATNQQDSEVQASTPLSLSAQAANYLNLKTPVSTTSMVLYIGGAMPASITAECAYL
jgi:hypothetical protein